MRGFLSRLTNTLFTRAIAGRPHQEPYDAEPIAPLEELIEGVLRPCDLATLLSRPAPQQVSVNHQK